MLDKTSKWFINPKKIIIILISIMLLPHCKSVDRFTCVEGNCKNGYGKAVFTANHEMSIEGSFKDGLPNGQGVLKDDRGCKYIGNFSNGYPNGYGEFTCPPGIKQGSQGPPYKGYRVYGRNHGYGEMIGPENKIYKGIWNEGLLCYVGNCKNGYGEYITVSWTHYKGNFKDGKKSGHGVLSFPGRDHYYNGNFEYGDYNGYGELRIISTGKVYKGLFRNGEFVEP